MNDTIEQYCWEVSRKKKDFGDAVLLAATADENDSYGQSQAKTVAQLIAKELKPIGKVQHPQEQEKTVERKEPIHSS